VPRRERSSLFSAKPLPAAELDHAGRLAALRLVRSDNVGAVTFRELINHFGSAVAALAALPELSRRGGRAVRLCTAGDAEAELEAAYRFGAVPVFTNEPGYPAALAAIAAPPPMIYIKGNAELLARPAMAIVGSRQASAAGIKVARTFAAELGAARFPIVSGLARGIDAAAHGASLATGTVAVLAGGLDVVYPPEHDKLQHRIGEQGCLVTEQPPGFEPRAKDFPRRNRLVSGLSLGVLVVEAARRSGTLTTARFAIEQGREVFAVPGHPLDPRAEGTNHLIKSGATLVTESADILSVLEPMTTLRSGAFTDAFEASPPLVPHSGAPPAMPQDADRVTVLNVLGPHPTDIDDVVRATGLAVRDVRIILMELDLAGRIERHGQHLVSRIEAADGAF
jgi:DNA processing protein